MIGTCYLHVGAAKTGSTSLQQALSRDLRDKRFLYVSGDHPNGSFALTAAYEIAPHNEGPFHAANLPGRFDRFRDRQLRLLERGFETARHSGRDLVLSSEETWLWSRPGLINLREALHRHHFAIQVIVYVRPRVPWIHSLFQQAVKMGGRDLNLPTHRGFRNLRVRDRLELFWDVFGRGQVQVRLCSPADCPGGCLVRDFCESLGWHIPPEPAWRSNESLNLPTLQLLYAYNRFGRPVGDWNRPIPHGYGELPARMSDLPGPLFAFHSRLLQPWLDELQPDDEWLARELGLQLSPSPLPPDAEQSVLCDAEMFRYAPETLEWLARETGQPVIPTTTIEATGRRVAAQVEVLRSRIRGSWIARGQAWWLNRWAGRSSG
ncbi:MAG: hypothetical protein ACK5EA_24995 [Planctomycetaceae bacterium]